MLFSEVEMIKNFLDFKLNRFSFLFFIKKYMFNKS